MEENYTQRIADARRKLDDINLDAADALRELRAEVLEAFRHGVKRPDIAKAARYLNMQSVDIACSAANIRKAENRARMARVGGGK